MLIICKFLCQTKPINVTNIISYAKLIIRIAFSSRFSYFSIKREKRFQFMRRGREREREREREKYWKMFIVFPIWKSLSILNCHFKTRSVFFCIVWLDVSGHTIALFCSTYADDIEGPEWRLQKKQRLSSVQKFSYFKNIEKIENFLHIHWYCVSTPEVKTTQIIYTTHRIYGRVLVCFTHLFSLYI